MPLWETQADSVIAFGIFIIFWLVVPFQVSCSRLYSQENFFTIIGVVKLSKPFVMGCGLVATPLYSQRNRGHKLSIEENIKKRITNLIERSRDLKVGDPEYGQVRTENQRHECSGWIASALNVVQLVCPNPEHAYRKRAEKIESKNSGWAIHLDVGELSSLLSELNQDIENGLLASVADRARAETFDNFLDHAKDYLKNNFKNEAGVIAGVVFEDCLRRIARKYGKEDKNEKLDTLITYLAQQEIISQAKAKRARAAAHVRTKATHAQWDEFDINDVQGTISFTEELLLAHLDQ